MVQREPGDQPAGGAFTWPPRKPVVVTVNTPRVTVRPRAAVPAPVHLGPWSRFEREFLGLRAGPLHQRAAEAGWAPESPCEHCHRCGRGVEDGEVTHEGCSRCSGVKFAWDRMVRLGEYAGVLRRWVHEVKFTRWRRLGLDLGAMLGDALVEAGASARADRPPVLIAVPDSTARRLWRGIDHTAVITEGVARATGWPVVQPLIRRFGRSQLSVRPSERASNVARSFDVRRGEWATVLADRTIVVIDDVITTGATMRACCRLARRAAGEPERGRSERPAGGLAVWAGCLARTEMWQDGAGGRA